jgi:hypothetical protein
MEENPPTRKIKCAGFKMVGKCDKCGQPIYEPIDNKHFSLKAFVKLRKS